MRQWLAVVCCLLVGSGCTGQRQGQAELKMWLVGSEAQARAINELAKTFAEQTGTSVRCEAISWGEAHSKYLTAVAGGVQPDLGTMGLTWGSEFGRLGALVDLRQAFPEDVKAMQQQTFPALWNSIEHGGQSFGIPFDLTLQLLFYRTDLVHNAPQTWEELVQLLEQLRQENRRMIIDWGSLSWIGYSPFLWQAGGDYYNANRTKATLDSGDAVRALTFFRDLYTVHGVPRTAIPIEQGLRSGEFPLAISGNWKMVSLAVGVKEIEGQWTIGALPKGPSGRRTAFLGGRIISIFARSPHRDIAWRFIRFLYEPAAQAKLYETAMQTQDAYLPPNMAAWDRLAMDPGMKAVLQQQAQDAKGPPAAPGWNESTNVIEAAIQRVVLGGADPKAALVEANQAMNRALQAEQ